MLINKKMLLALVLVAALVGGGVGALITHSTAQAENYSATATVPPAEPNLAQTPAELAAANAAQLKTPEEQLAYRRGFDDGFATAESARLENEPARSLAASYRAPVRRSSSTRRAYYDYNNQPRSRSFWQKHRDKLTMAMGTGGGAIIGGLIGGKKGAAIGALSGLGGSALYTYKLRKRSPRRY